MNTYNDTIKNTNISIRRSYHTNIKLFTKLNLLPIGILSFIPKSNISRWKNTDFSDVFGMELLQYVNNNLEIMKDLMKYKKFAKACICLIRIKNTVIDALKKTRGKIKDAKVKEMIICTVDRVKETLSLQRAVHYFRITIQQYYTWVHQTKKKCLETILDQCPRVYPNQLCKSEIKKIKECLWDMKYRGWAIYSIAWECIKKGILYVSPTTWYKYAKILGFSRKLPQSRKKYSPGIRAEQVIEKIHADVTIFQPLDNTKVYIYIIMDNRSRYIFRWKASLKLSAGIFIENLKEVYKKYLLPFYHGKSIDLIVDGGAENNNHKVDGFLDDIQGVIQKLVAQKDILFSNSMIESVNKTLKYCYLFHHEIQNFESTVKHLEKAVLEYNNRPHYAHKGLTPTEVLKGIELDREQIKNYFYKAYRKRIDENHKIRCKNREDDNKN